MKWMPIAAFILILLAGIFLRVPDLAERPMHHDEANQAYRFGILLEQGSYEYDADDHHGPTLYYLTLPIAWLTGAKTFQETTEYTYRLLPLVFGVLLIFGVPLLRNGIGCIAVLGASFLTAISPAMAYYSRMYIQETSLVFFTLIMIAAGWQSFLTGSRRWAVASGIAAGLMFSTKETAIISYAAMGGSALFCMLLTKKFHIPLKNILIGIACAAAVSFILFSSFLTNLDGPLESILAFKTYFARGAGAETDHTQPFNFYLQMLTYYQFDGGPVWSEGLVFGFGLLGCGLIIAKKVPGNTDPGLARFFMFYTILLTLAYSVLSYKTPWCILSFLHGWIILGGIAMASLFEIRKQGWKPRLQSAATLTLILALAYPTYSLARRTVFRYAADYRNPYVYAHTSPDFKNLIKRIGELEAISPKGNKLFIQVIADPDATWPLPFYLRKFPNTGYWNNADNQPETPKPDIIISRPELEPDSDAWLSEYYGLRADTLLAVHINRELWDAFIETRK